MVYFFILAILNLVDGVVTFWGLSNQWIGEANPLMNWLWHKSPSYFLMVKITLSIALAIIGVYFDDFSFKRIWKFTLRTVNFLYGLVILLHLYWVTSLFT